MTKNDRTKFHTTVNNLRKEYLAIDSISQSQFEQDISSLENIKDQICDDKSNETLIIVDANGVASGKYAPRWFCHLIGLRHRSVHILLNWNSPNLGIVYVLQIRSWYKVDSPAHIDISAGGHVIGKKSRSSIESALRELEEELGINKSDLVNNNLVYKTGYSIDNAPKTEFFFNNEWRDIYIGELQTNGLEKIQFNDNEVVGLYLCPQKEALKLLNQSYLPIANALKNSLPFCLQF